MRKVQRQRHVVLRLCRRIAEHHPLVARALLTDVLRALPVHAARDIRALLMQRREDTATLCLELIRCLRVTDTRYRLTSHALHIHIFLTRNLTGNNHLTGRYHRLARHMRIGVLCQEIVENSVADLVCHFVGVSFRHRLTCK